MKTIQAAWNFLIETTNIFLSYSFFDRIRNSYLLNLTFKMYTEKSKIIIENLDVEKWIPSLQFDPEQQSTLRYVTPKINDPFIHGPHCFDT